MEHWIVTHNESVPDYRVIPSIEQLRQRPAITVLEQQYGHVATIDALRAGADAVRGRIAQGHAYSSVDVVAAELESHARATLAATARGSLRRVINTTGVVLHTNLGRAPLAAAALQHLQDVCAGYCNLEYDISEGRRGSRALHAESLLRQITGAEAAVVVNNNAAATMLILAALGTGREVVISRGELVEIGGGFRVPDIMTQSGAMLREVGTTNRTRVADYRAALSDRTAMVLRVHPSNFRIEGFTERPALTELVTLAREAHVPVVEDLGSGCVLEHLAWEPTVQASVAAGADLVCFSGDKMLGGPQAGIIVGRRNLVDRLARHPLMRAVRVDKLTLAALEGTLMAYHAGRAIAEVPAVQMLSVSADVIEGRAQALAEQLHPAGWRVALMSGASAVGGGSAPGVELPTVLIALAHGRLSADALERQLRQLDPPVIARIESDRVVLDLRTVSASDEEMLVRLLVDLGARLAQ
jgi:L-seryl-tRNA(Ser) seleniumtransferase